MDTHDTLVIIPTYNEIGNVRPLSEAVFGVCPDVDLLFVDDQSPDGTGRTLDEMAALDPRIHVLHRKEKAGLGRAYIAGFEWAMQRSYRLIFEMDADFSHRPCDLPMLRDAARDADLVLGSRYLKGIRVMNWPLSRLILSKTAAFYVRLITGMPFKDPTGGFKCYRRAVLETIPFGRIHSTGYSFQIETTHEAWMHGFRVMEIPIVFEERRTGSSKLDMSVMLETVWRVWKLWFRWRCRRRPPPRQQPSRAGDREAGD